jgi:hypothetical protein
VYPPHLGLLSCLRPMQSPRATARAYRRGPTVRIRFPPAGSLQTFGPSRVGRPSPTLRAPPKGGSHPAGHPTSGVHTIPTP